MKIFRHGDLLIKELKELPKNLKKLKTDILAFGEATGHHHRLEVAEPQTLEIYEDAEGRKYFKTEGAKLTHQEHKTISIEKGLYVVGIERERDPFLNAIRQVQD